MTAIVVDCVIVCTKCGHRFKIERDPPPLPGALGFDCAECYAYIVCYRGCDGVRAAEVTRTGARTRGQA